MGGGGFIFHFYKLEGIFQLVAGVGSFWSIIRYIKGGEKSHLLVKRGVSVCLKLIRVGGTH